MSSSSVLILCSGGIDSTALIKFYQKQGVHVCGLHFQYGQKNDQRELEAIGEISNFFSVPIEVKQLGFSVLMQGREYYCRNALLVIAAASSLPGEISKIAIGIHRGSPYYDCSKSFLSDCQRILDGYFGGTIIVEAPFQNFSKKHIFEYCKAERIPIELTYSCEDSNYSACGICPSCLDRRAFFCET